MPYRRVKDPKEVVVIFKLFMRDDADLDAYGRTSRRMHELVEKLPGFISLKEYTGEDGEVLDIARFRDEASLEAWRREPEHLEAQRQGREEFYDHYAIQALRVIRDYEFRRHEPLRRTAPSVRRPGGRSVPVRRGTFSAGPGDERREAGHGRARPRADP